MTNELLWIGSIFLVLSANLVLLRVFGRAGLYGALVLSVIVCNIQVMKIVEIFGLTATLGNILYAGIFFATDLINELYGPSEARRAVWLGLAALLLTTLYLQIDLLYLPAPEDFIHPALADLFGFFPRIAAASLAAYLVSQLHDVWAFQMWKRKTSGRHLWLRNNASTLVSQLIDTLVFSTIAFAGLFSAGVFVQLVVTTYLFKLIVAAADTPFIYWGRRIARKYRL